MHEQGLVTELRRMQLVLDHLPKLEMEQLPREAKRAERGAASPSSCSGVIVLWRCILPRESPSALRFHSRLSDALSSYRSHQKGGTLEKRCPRVGRWGGRSDPVWGRRRCSGGAWQCEADVAA